MIIGAEEVVVVLVDGEGKLANFHRGEGESGGGTAAFVEVLEWSVSEFGESMKLSSSESSRAEGVEEYSPALRTVPLLARHPSSTRAQDGTERSFLPCGPCCSTGRPFRP